MKFQAIIFDLFGTLVDDFAASTRQTNVDLAAVLGVPREPFTEKWRQTSALRIDGTFQTIEASIEYVCDAIGAQVSREQMKKSVKIRLQQIRRALKPKPDAVATVTRLKEAGYRLGLLSNCSIEIPILWPETPLAAFFDAIVFSSRECLKKPDLQIFRLACDRLGVVPKECVYIADGENRELTAAANVGLHPVLIRNASAESRREIFREARQWRGFAITSLSDVLTLLGVRSGTTPSRA
ncbi:MAG TPA: HAD-IA family hydrolase [Candidatus Binatia bacterium]|jgi:putative hydrolase of the HAD superfamily